MRGAGAGPIKGYVPGWGVVSGVVSALEERFQGREFFFSLVVQEKQADMVTHLQDTVLKDCLTPALPWEDFTAVADSCFADAAAAIRPLCPVSAPVDVFVAPYDFLNLKDALMGRDAVRFPSVLFDRDLLGAVARGDTEKVPESLRQCPAWASWDPAQALPLDMDLMVDGAYCRHVLALAGESRSGLVEECVTGHVEASLLKLFWRASLLGFPARRIRRFFEPMGDLGGLLDDIAGQAGPHNWPEIVGGPLGDLMARALEEPGNDPVGYFSEKAAVLFTTSARAGRSQTAGPERVFAFMAEFYDQVTNLKLAVAGRLGNVGQDVLRRRLELRYG